MAMTDLLEHLGDLKELPDGWHWHRLRDLVDQSRGICYGIVQPGQHDPQGIPMVNSQDVISGRSIDDIKFRVSSAIHQKYKRSTIQGGEILLTLVGANFGQVGVAPPHLTGSNCSRPVGIIPIVQSPLFVSHCLRGPVCRRYMDNWANTTAQPTLNLKDVSNLPIPLPPLAEQKAIAHIIGILDEKIELNRKRNGTLEGTAKALFKSWFVDFDPVRAKAERRQTGLSDEITKLFPDSFEDSKRGEVPKDWKAQIFGDFTTARRGKMITRKDTEEGQVPVVAGGMTPAYFHNQSNVDGPVVTISASGANAGFVNLHFEPIWASDCSYISRTESEFPFACYLFLKASQNRIYDAQHGGVQPHVNPGDLGRLDFVIAEKQIFKCFEKIITPTFLRIESNTKESKHLECLRDALLPRLISGELRVPDAEKMLEEVGI